MRFSPAVQSVMWLGLVACLASHSAVALAQTAYRLREVPPSVDPRNPTVFTFANAINRSGQMASGLYQQLGGGAPFRCDKMQCVDIPPLGYTHHGSTSAVDINDAGFVVGTSPYLYMSRGYRFDGAGTKNLGAFPEDYCDGCSLSSEAYGINNLGQIVGASETADGPYRAFIWQDDVMTKLGTLGGDTSVAHAINDRGDVVGDSTLADGRWHAFFYRHGRMHDLGTLGGSWSTATAVNNLHQAVGCSRTAGDAQTVAFLFDAHTVLPLPTLGGSYACASGINANGWVVGSSLTAGDAEWHGFLYDGTTMIDLNDTLSAADRANWTVTEANGINKKGQIAGAGTYKPYGTSRALLLTPRQPREDDSR